jgi:hypothetical protein
MGSPAILLWIGVAVAPAAILLLRLAWAQPSRSVPRNAAGWGLLLGGLLCGMASAGAWGLAVVTLCAVAMAFLCLTHAAMTAPQGKATASNRRVRMLPEGNEPLRLPARLLTFLLTVPAALLSALALSIGARAVALGIGASEADGNVLTLFLMPILWAVLATWLLMESRRRRQLLLLALPALTGALAIAATGAAA